jgi:Recombination endonuclease VII
MADGIDVLERHDTELCASSDLCDREVYAFDLCQRHYARDRKRGELIKFQRYAAGRHDLGERVGGQRWCSLCRSLVKLDSEGTCMNAQIARQRARMTGWSQEDYDLALIEQGNRCWLCGSPPGAQGLHADHDHATGSKRRLLCGSCNRGLGYFRDNPAVLIKAADYVGGFDG